MNNKKILSFLFVFIIFTFSSIYGIEADNIILNLDIENNVDDLNERFYFEMVSKDDYNPMPDNSEDGVYEFYVEQAGERNIGPIEFDEPGIYEYEVYQIKGNNPLFAYDDTKYRMIISVTNNEMLDDLDVDIIITDMNGEEKFPAFQFTNTYFPPATIDVNTSDINVYLYVVVSFISLGVATYLMEMKKVK